MAVGAPVLLLFAIVGHVNASRIHARPQSTSLAQDKAASKHMAVPIPASLVEDKAASKHTVASSHSKEQSVETLEWKPSSEVPRFVLVLGIGTSLTAILCCLYCLMDRCLSASSAKDEGDRQDISSKKSSGASHVSKGSGSANSSPATSFERERKQHLHEGRVVYEWDQIEAVAKIYLKVPEHITKEDLDITISSRHVTIGCKDKPPFLSEDTYQPIVEAESMWRLRGNGELQIHLQKATPAEWSRVLGAPDEVKV